MIIDRKIDLFTNHPVIFQYILLSVETTHLKGHTMSLGTSGQNTKDLRSFLKDNNSDCLFFFGWDFLRVFTGIHTDGTAESPSWRPDVIDRGLKKEEINIEDGRKGVFDVWVTEEEWKNFLTHQMKRKRYETWRHRGLETDQTKRTISVESSLQWRTLFVRIWWNRVPS